MKMGRPHKNIYDQKRLQRAYSYISKISGSSDYKLSQRMSLVLPKFFNINVRLESLRAWISQMRRGTKASISPEHLWSLIYVAHPDYLEKNHLWADIDTALARGDHTEATKLINGVREIAAINWEIANHTMSLLHYAYTPDFYFLKKFLKAKVKLFIRKGYAIYSLVYDGEGKWVYPLFDHFDIEDLAIDVAELTKIDFNQALQIVQEVDKIFQSSIDANKYWQASVTTAHSLKHIYFYESLEFREHKLIRKHPLSDPGLIHRVEELVHKILQIIITVRVQSFGSQSHS